MTAVRRVGVLILLVGLLVATGVSAHHEWRHEPTPQRYPFVIKGDVANLYPGATKRYAVTLTNHNSFAIVVTDVAVRADDASRKCSRHNLSSPGFHGAVVVPAHRTASITVPISMSAKAPDACQGAKFPLTYSGSGRRL